MARTPGGTLSAFTLLSTPDEPTITSITTSIGSATVAFTAPTDVGDAAVSSYVVTAVDESSGASTGATGSASPINLSLSSGTFKIRMQALNAYGPGRLTEYDTGNAIYSGAELYAWGRNDTGLGDGTTIRRSSPVQIGSLTTWSLVSAGTDFTAAIKTDGTMWMWGQNANGELGDGTQINKSSPIQVGALTTWYQVSCGGNHSVAVKTDGTLWAWGAGSDGRLGDGTTVSKSSPVQIGALTDWSMAASGTDSTIAIKTSGTIWSWGRNNLGQLGQNISSVINRSSPVQIGALSNWSKAYTGSTHVVAIKTDGTLWTWGLNNHGQIGDNTYNINRSSPVQVGALTTWSRAVANGTHTLAIKLDNSLWDWGRNNLGQLGDDTVISRSSPIQVGSLTDWSQVAAGTIHTVATKTDGTLWAWGYNGSGCLGDNTTVSKSSPIQVGSLTSWVTVSANSIRSLALYGVV